MSYLTSLSPAQLNRAAKIKSKIETLNRELATILGVDGSATAPTGVRKTKFSAAGLDRIRAAQKKRWAKIKGLTAGLAAAPAKPAKTRKFSAAGLARIKAAQKLRWSKVKSAKA